MPSAKMFSADTTWASKNEPFKVTIKYILLEQNCGVHYEDRAESSIIYQASANKMNYIVERDWTSWFRELPTLASYKVRHGSFAFSSSHPYLKVDPSTQSHLPARLSFYFRYSS